LAMRALLSRRSIVAAVSFSGLMLGPVSAQTEQEPQQPREDAASKTVLKAASRLDGFFGTEEYSWRSNQTRVTVRGDLLWVDDHGTDAAGKLKLNLDLPGFRDRLRLIVNEEEEDVAAGGLEDEDDADVALRYFPETARKYGVNFDLGISTRGDPTIQGFGRVNLFREWGLGDSSWVARAENRLYWYTDSKWRNDFRWYFERRIGDRLLFRSRTRLDYQEDKDENWLPEQRFTLYQQINDRTALAYEAIAQKIFFDDSVFDEDEILDPCEKCTQYQLRLRFRRNMKKFPRLYYEVWPIAGWAEQRDYDFTPAALLRLEMVFGGRPERAELH